MNETHKRKISDTPSAAAWPTGVSLLAQLVDACQRCDIAEVCSDSLVRTSSKAVAPPAICPSEPVSSAKRNHPSFWDVPFDGERNS